MNQAQIEIQLVAAIVAAACALPGCFLVLRRMALISDAISHTVLLGIVLGFMVVGDLHSPVLLIGAAAVGVLTVFLIEALLRTGRVKEDAAIALVFPALFSIGIILISHDIHDVFDLADRLAVMRHGKVVGTTPTADVTKDEVLAMIIAGTLPARMNGRGH